MKPKKIPDNFIVQINNITELGELCTILRDNGWRQRNGILYRETGCVMTIDRKNRMAIFRTRRDEEDIEILTLDEFKERYSNLPKSVGLKTETKANEDMETKEEKSENPINLCELLHEGDTVYSLINGEGKVGSLDKNGFIVNYWFFRNDGTLDGYRSSTANCLIYPSRALYEQYPLDPYTAWSVWQKEQTQYKVHLMLDAKPECPFSSEADSYEFAFHTPADRDKCIEEIKAIIEKYSKK